MTTHLRKLQSKLGYAHPYFYDTLQFDGNLIGAPASTPSASVRAAIKIPDYWDIAYEQVFDSNYYQNTYVTRNHIVPHPTTEVASGERSEVLFDAIGSLGNVIDYTCYHLFDASFTDDYPDNRFMILQQWHPQSGTASPENLIAYVRLDATTRVIGYKFGNIDATDPATYIPVTLGTWIKIRTRIKWSTGSDGYAYVYYNGNSTPIFTFSGATLTQESVMQYYKVGLYRNRDINVTQNVRTKWIKQQIIS